VASALAQEVEIMSSRWERRDRNLDRGRGGLAFGAVLIALGALLLLSEQLNVDVAHYGWPAFVIVPGVIMLVIGLAIPSEGGLGLAIPGGIVTTVGGILAFQQATEAWGSWAYMWALVAPGSVGVTLLLYGILHRRFDLVDGGIRTAAVGLGLFIGFGLFFENIIGLDEGHSNTILHAGLPYLAVAMGVLIVISNVLPSSRSGHAGSTPTDSSDGGASSR
jgi:hypothetical protein